MRETLTIGEVARRAGMRSSAIRYYESVQVLPAPRRINGRRRYDPDVLRRLAVIQLAQEAGFSMSQIRLLFNNPEGDCHFSDNQARFSLITCPYRLEERPQPIGLHA